jgi:hypothetical protein
MKKLGFIVLILAASFVLIAATHSYTKLARLTLVNKTGETLHVRMRSGAKAAYYWHDIDPGTHVFTVDRLKYRLTVWGCETSTSTDVDVQINFRITFPRCGVDTNKGVPPQIKVHLTGD